MVAAYPPPPPPAITARAAVVVDGDTGQVLFARNPHEELPNASTTKLMTALVAVSNGNLNQVVTVSTDSARVGGSSLYLEAGERMTLEQLLYGMLMISGNDAADAIARAVGGSDEHFVAMMNARAASMHLTDTHYANPHGLPDPDHYTSAYDLTVIARAAFANPEIAKITDTRTLVMQGNDRIKRRFLVNHNKLLGRFDGALGGKTGYTRLAGRCFVGSARRNGRFVIEAVLHSRRLWHDSAALLNYGLDDFQNYAAVAQNTIEGQVPVQGGQDKTVTAVLAQPAQVSVPKGDPGTGIVPRVLLDPQVVAPVAANQPLGQLELTRAGSVLASFPLVAQQADSKGVPLTRRLLTALGWFFSGGLISFGLFGAVRWRLLRMRRRDRRPAARVAAQRS